MQDSKGGVCFHCGLVDGSQASGCFTIFLSENTTWNTSIIILRSCFICLNNTQCIRDVIEGTYSARFYLIENDGQISTNGSHKIIQNIFINNYVTNTPAISATTTMAIGKLDIIIVMKVCIK